MPVTAVTTDPDSLTLSVVADFTAPVRRLWDAYLDPRQLERFWGPPEYPATFTRHDGFVGGLSAYFMTGPEGDTHGGYWKWVAVDEGRSFEVRDGFANDDGSPNTELPEGRMVLEFTETALGSRVSVTSYFGSVEEMEQLQAMGMVEGMREAMGQMDAVLADLATFAAELPTQLQLIGDTRARVSRVIRGTVEQVWRAHHEAELMRRWMLGPDGWEMPVCEVASAPGERFRQEWRNLESGETFGFTGEFLEGERPVRAVTTEAMTTPEDPDGAQSPVTRNELTLTPVEGGTLLTLLITYPDAATREMILATGMVDGMETSYLRLEREALVAA
ncbi:ATPase [Leucobacter sp. OLJS4]|uniref:SRPBCC family protein n=1 Tax=unclassified Leucobacter TaxID=2621730 RepID=UPI000C1A71C2|nr:MULTISPECIES: SRPBCC family protein [unclassified Leucobacter]PII84776.1 ATPase [Leucobacter sp. OLCALW19]PII87797.1 ATPase [Leucobacter sp. OLTLW20]PII93885.1 ATPase [Leucobacter sp. OLAS13]PII98446.1 ATPase [Leucobacter sp. OLDS2]PIJ00427.1 ATPase [Leucobacter sp. OLCS4]